MAKSKKVDPIKQREKRAKIAAAIGGVLFLVVAAIEIPSMMSALNKKPPPGANATDAGNRNPDGSIPLPNVSVTSGLSGNGQLADTDVPPQTTSAGQLVSFSVFQTKNPFAPQVTSSDTKPAVSAPSTADKGGADVPPSQTATTPTATVPTTTTSVVPPTVTTPVATTPTSTTPVVAPPPTVTIKVNGVSTRVAAEGTFPSSSPVFRLVSFTSESAEIAIVGGSYASGEATLTLHLGRPVTLENQTDDKRYTIELTSTR